MSKQPSSKRRKMRAERSDHKRESRSNFDDLKCDSCNNTILSANNADHHVQNTPCNHNICMLCVIKTNMRRGCSNTSGCCCQVKSCNKYITSCQYFRAGSPGEVIRNGRGDDHHTIPSLFDDLDTGVLANIFGYLLPEDFMRARLNKKMREAAKKSIVPLTAFRIDSVRKYNLMAAMTTASPNLQRLSIRNFGVNRHKYSDGEDPDEEETARTAHYTIHDIDIISNFTKLRILEIWNAPLNGRYPALFKFPLLQKLTIQNPYYLKWDLEMLEGLPLLKELDCYKNLHLTGNLSSLRVLKDTLEEVKMFHCRHVEGAFMDLADFPRLKKLELRGTNVTGHIRDIVEHHFPALEKLFLPGCELLGERIASTAIRNFKHLKISSLSDGHKYSDGEDPDEEEAARTAHYTIHDINIISNFTKLRSLEIDSAPLNGRYPALFNFPLLQKLKLGSLESSYLRWDLEMLAGLPLLKDLDCDDNLHLTGNLSSLRVLKDVIEKVKITWCSVEGNFMDLADFPRLKELDLRDTNVVGDIREVGERDFLALESFNVPGHKFQRISDAPDLIHTFLPIMRQRPTLLKNWWLELSEGSPDWYYLNSDGDDDRDSEYFNVAPMRISIVQAGPRIGWRWISEDRFNVAPMHIDIVQAGPHIGWRWISEDRTFPCMCEMNWLHPEPSRESSDYEKYTEELGEIDCNVPVQFIYEGFHEPPTEEQCRRLWDELLSD